MLSFYYSILNVFVISVVVVQAQYGTDSSFDSLVSSQCRTRCFGLYPWNLSSESQLELPQALRYFRREKRVRFSSDQFLFLITNSSLEGNTIFFQTIYFYYFRTIQPRSGTSGLTLVLSANSTIKTNRDIISGIE